MNMHQSQYIPPFFPLRQVKPGSAHLVAPKCEAGTKAGAPTKAPAAADAHTTKAFLAAAKGCGSGGGLAPTTKNERPNPGAPTNSSATTSKGERADALGEPSDSGFSSIGGAAATLVVVWSVEPSGLDIDPDPNGTQLELEAIKHPQGAQHLLRAQVPQELCHVCHLAGVDPGEEGHHQLNLGVRDIFQEPDEGINSAA